MPNNKPNQKIQLDKLQATLAELEQLQEKPKEELSLRESIYFLRNKLNLALKKGYNHQELSEILEQQGILISAATLKQYLAEINKEASKGKRSTKAGKASLASSATASPQLAATPEENNPSQTESHTSENLGKNEEKAFLEQAQGDDEKEIQKASPVSKRKTREASKPRADIENEFNQY